MSSEIVPLQHYAESVDETLSGVEGIETRDEFLAYSDLLRDIKTRRKIIDEEREKVLKPQREAMKASRALFDKIDEQYAQAEERLKTLLADFQRTEQERERKALAEALESDNARALVNLAAQAAPVAQGITMRTVYGFLVTDPDKVPDEYWVLDEKKIGAVVRASKGTAKIPGIEVTQSTSVGARAK